MDIQVGDLVTTFRKGYWRVNRIIEIPQGKQYVIQREYSSSGRRHKSRETTAAYVFPALPRVQNKIAELEEQITNLRTVEKDIIEGYING